MPINSKQKGARGEREIAKKLRDFGFKEAHRTCQFSSNGEETNADVMGLPGIHIEVKYVEKLNIFTAYEQSVRDSQKSGDIPTVFHRKNGKEWLCTLKLDHFLGLYAEYLRNKEK